MNKNKILVLIFFLTFSKLCFAQFPFQCKLSDVPNFGFQCPSARFVPVCGCDSVTYRNECDAFGVHTVQFYTNGICNNVPFAIDVYPTVFTQSAPLNLAIQAANNTSQNFQIYIWDVYGLLHVYRAINGANRIDLIFEASKFSIGVYIIWVVGNNGNFLERRKVIVS